MAKRRTGKSKQQYVERQEAKLKREPKTVVVERELDRIKSERGRVDPESVLQDAADPRSALHQYFEWNDTLAGRKYRLQQAYRLIQATKYVYLTRERSLQNSKVKNVVSLPSGPVVRKYIRSSEGGFTVREEALEENDSRALFIEAKRSILVGWCREVVDIQELDHIRLWLENELGLKKPIAAE